MKQRAGKFSSSMRGRHGRSALATVIVLTIVKSLDLECATSSDSYPGPQLAYIGPGAGIALLGSFLVVCAGLVLSVIALLTLPIRIVWRSIRHRAALARAKVKRVVILGLDGLDPQLTEQFLKEGLLPNLASLRESGSYCRLGTTWPPLSPVAWSSFSTGTNPGKHNIFDFILRNASDYRPAISSVRIRPARHRVRLGRYQLPLSRASIQSLRRSKAFWNVLGDAGIFSAVLRVPISFPPDKFRGVQLAAMCVPDLRGSQGTFFQFIESNGDECTADQEFDGLRVLVTKHKNSFCAELPGPANPLRSDGHTANLPLKVTRLDDNRAVLLIDGQRIPLAVETYTDWIRVGFRLAPGIKVRGMCRFLLRRLEPFEMYGTPLQIDPARPVMSISHPKSFAVYLSKQHGPFATLGLAEDTTALSDHAIDEEQFLRQTFDIDAERQRMFFDSLRRVSRGMVVCVFDAPDRIQHMFWRFLDENHPAVKERPELISRYRNVIRDLYIRMDELVGRTIQELGPDTALLVMSDHGFNSFDRAVDLNAWLLCEGYLSLKDDAPTSTAANLEDVDWSRTKAYAFGLAGIYLNQKQREPQGIVEASARQPLIDELCGKLTQLHDPDRQSEAIHAAIPRESAYSGPYLSAAPDILVGYNVGYRVSWGAAKGQCGRHVFSDNTNAWSGDHCIHPDLVPGILFSNLKLNTSQANIVDLAPTALDLFGLPKPHYMDGDSLLCDDAISSK